MTYPAAAVGDIELAGVHGISVSHLRKRFHRRGSAAEIQAVDDVSIDVAKGEFVVLLGPSGCGKTTLLRCVSGLETPDAGEITTDGRVLYSSAARVDVPVNKRSMSMIFQGYALWPHMKVFDTVAYPLRARGVRRKADLTDRVGRVLDLVGLSGLEREYPGTLSGGQQQRVSLARALVAEPAVILFDEPLSSVDAKVRTQLREEIRSMHRRLGFTALYVTHDQEEALSLAVRIAVLDSGRVAQYSAPREVYDNPATAYVAAFIGRANLLPVTVTPVDGPSVRLECDIGTVVVPRSAIPDTVTVGVAATAVIRPEDLRIGPAGDPAAGDLQVAAVVQATEFQGSHTDVTVRTAGGTSLRVEAPKGADIPAEGDPVSLRVAGRRIRVVPR
jgi:iron(III) transport system ATP-binding protein